MIDRRLFLTGGWAAAALGGATGGEVKRRAGSRIKIGLNAYSFNRPLMAGTMTIPDVIDYCAQQEIDGVDLTGYYFKGYPNAPSDEVIYSIKRAAFLNGVTITGTGVRNDFALTDPSSRRGHIQLVKDWVDVAAKLGSDMVRVFSGREHPKGYTFEQVLEWMVPAFQECAEYGAKRGVIVGLQHHDDFLKTAEQTIRVVDLVKSEWFSVILDVGSLRQGDPYAEIEKLLPYASNWQVKEHVWYGTKKVEIDLPRIRKIIDKVGYRGFTPIEALGEGDPKAIVTAFLGKVRQAFA
ncbi:MAG: sugar phosphate isomerase/epimerase [Acidobacteria bacterium]|jgi:sugar phosphate isomerase/epimerase|nr:sugar phosphate isomerase/epimerase [Bryobacteraceae bacterium CoA2 C42]